MVKTFAEEQEYGFDEYSDAFKKELDNQYEAYRKEELEVFTYAEVKEPINQIINSNSSKTSSNH